MDTPEVTTFSPPENFAHLGRLKNGGGIKGVRNVGTMERLSHLGGAKSLACLNDPGSACNRGSFIHLGGVDDSELETQENLKQAQAKKFVLKYEENREDILRRITNSLRDDYPKNDPSGGLQSYLSQKRHQVGSPITTDNSNVELLKNMSSTYGLLKIFLITFFASLVFFAFAVLIKHVYRRFKKHMENRLGFPPWWRETGWARKKIKRHQNVETSKHRNIETSKHRNTETSNVLPFKNLKKKSSRLDTEKKELVRQAG
ncbi:hypothetical protein PVX_086030 [Plasmodium vivax]|uniref:Uncharacterized protein n=2 Tax=Plasmodium vivax TaxID=5855 RepID=A5K1E5_PLAVS|nr:hypothetical protein PVX_086030 [Plasmodium vivax]EDL47142.1 hypothetical protein PVX_086030 [Plasmodium vivax]KMZ83939.1 hypothetical protein PVBG_01018 [Plasmodium vivax Brazil I]|eukprot:XP_001616869.1 hypothetical protein [Plasmodium vivax Sal-1]